MKQNELAVVEPQAVQISKSDVQAGGLLGIIARAASDPAVDVGKMERLYAMLREEKASIAQQEFNAAMSAAQAEIPMVVKKSTNPQTNSRYAKLEALSKAAAPVIEKHSLSLMFSEGESPNPAKIRIACKVCHKGGHSENFHIDLSPDDTGAKGNPSKTKIHGEGSTFSYGRRYLTAMIFNMIVIGEDDDGNQGQRPRTTDARVVTPEIRMRFFEVTKDIHQKMQAWAIDKALIMPDEGLGKLPDNVIPTTKGALAKFRAEVEVYV